MGTLADNEALKQKLVELKAALLEWENKKTLEIRRGVIMLQNIKTPMEKASDSYIDSMSTSIKGTLDGISR